VKNLTEREEQLLRLIRKNPFMSQQEMADELNISRPLLANIISSLVKEGKILGRAYILPNDKEIVCIGGANMDRKLFLKQALQLGTSIPTSSTYSIGGVARNIAENLGRLGHNVTFMTTCGRDADWEVIEKHSQKYMNVSHCKMIQDANTGSYTAILDENNDLVLACANMDVYEELNENYIISKQNVLLSAQLVVMDLNCPKNTIAFTQQFCRDHGIPFIIVPVSGPKMNRLPDSLNHLEWFICNTEEAGIILKREILTHNHYEQALDRILELGAKNAVVTAGAKGAFSKSFTEPFRYHPAPKPKEIKDVTGAGDAFVSGVIHQWLLNKKFMDCLEAGLVNAQKTLQSNATVRYELTEKLLLQELEEFVNETVY